MPVRTFAWAASALLIAAPAAAARTVGGTPAVPTATRATPPVVPATQCAPGQPIGGIVVKGGKNPGAKTVCQPTTAKSISEKGVSSTKSR